VVVLRAVLVLRAVVGLRAVLVLRAVVGLRAVRLVVVVRAGSLPVERVEGVESV